MMSILQTAALLFALTGTGVRASADDGNGTDYLVYVAAESEDIVAVAKFDAATRKVEVVKRVSVGYQPTEVEGPHGLTVDPDGRHWYLSVAHGKPYGYLYKYTTETDDLVGRCELGLFPATMEISRATGLLYCVNFNLHGRMEPSTVSIVDPEEMVEVARTTTGTMPHGSRITPDGMLHYSCSMMSDMLYEIDAVTFELKRQLRLTISDDAADAPMGAGPMNGAGTNDGAMGDGDMPMGDDVSRAMAVAKPTWAYPHPTKDLVYVALNGAAQVVEVDTQTWKITRRFETAKAPYNLEVTRDGRKLVVTHKGAQSVGIWDLETGNEVARVPTSRKVTHGVVLSPDSRFAFVSNESIGSNKGTLDVIDLSTNELVSSTDIGLQAGGIAFWKMN